MRKIIIAVVAAAVALLTLAPSASADHAADWSANGDSFVVDETTVHLEGEDTSVETGNLNLNVDEGDPISFEFTLHGDVECNGPGQVYVFIVINGNYYWSHEQIPATPCGDGGTVEFPAPDTGLITQTGIVQYQPGKVGHTLVSNLTVDGEVVHFLNPEPVDEPTDEPTDDPTEPVDEPTNEPTDEPTEPAPVIPTAVPAGSGTLPDTGPAELLGMTAVGLALLGVGGLILRRRATSAR